MANYYIYLAVIVSGASVLAIEILGTRIIGPFYGVSLYLWSALISVTLAALSIGYAIGGRMADRGTRLNTFCVIIGLAGLWISLIPWLRHFVLTVAEPVGLRAAVLITATILFLPPLTLLGMVSPYAIRLKASSLDVVGRTAGNLYALSTVASVVAAVCTGFFLIPNFGVSRLTFMVGVALMITSAIGLAIGRKLPTRLTVMIAAPLLVATAVVAGPSEQEHSIAGLIAIEQSPYAEIRIVDQNGSRYMLIDGGTHTIVDAVTMESYFPYVDVLDIAKMFYDKPGSMLLIGLGGGSVVKSFVRDGWNVEAVEIDPVVTKFAIKYFGFDSSQTRVHHKDGREFLIEQDKLYDLVIVDAFGSSSIPFHLVTEESFGLIRSRLIPEGIMAMNIEAVGWHDKLVHSLFATLNKQFRFVKVLPMAEPPNQIGNLILLASNHELTLAEDPPVPQGRFTREYNRAHAWDNRFEIDTTGVQVLTDDLNPVDIWAERINLVARKNLHDFFGSKGLDW